MIKTLKQKLIEEFAFTPNHNQLRDLERLVFEIIRREEVSLQQIVEYLKNTPKIEKYQGRNKFIGIKEALIERRFPITSCQKRIDAKEVFLSKLRTPLTNNYPVQEKFKPAQIFVEKSVKTSYLVDNFRNSFPGVKIEELDYYNSYIKGKGYEISELKKPLVFLVKESWDFVKPCPCTKEHLGCGYWIFNLGFGCPFDCSYCFLQHYTNFPGLILPANIDDFFAQFEKFHKNLKSPIRIGTGEFCDSLALDHVTQYSKKLIPYFADKNVFFELKTKSVNIDNLLTIPAPKNIVISWSLNTTCVASNEEKGAASIEERLFAAKKVQEHGYKIGFHFDPIIHWDGWDKEYKKIVELIYDYVKPPLAWISLGTLRSNRELKNIVEQRFPDSNIFYGELLLGEDKKLRYPKFMRQEIYTKMFSWIRDCDKQTPIYLCMENKEMWEVIDKDLDTTVKIEKYIKNQ